MNNAYVYKTHSFVSKNECVRIPDGNIKHDAINLVVFPKSEDEILDNSIAAESDTIAINPNPAGIPDEPSVNSDCCLNDKFSENSESVQDAHKPRKKAAHHNVEVSTLDNVSLADRETLSVIYKKELDLLSQSVAEAAYFDALNKKKRELKDCISDVKTTLDELVKKHEEFMEQYTNELKYMAIDIAEKMICDKIKSDDEVLKKLVLQNIKSVKSAEWINVELSEKLVGLVDSIKTELETPEYKGRTSVVPVADKDDVCRITTEDGTIVSDIGVQADNLRKAFREADKE